jgi:hypothetical protein
LQHTPIYTNEEAAKIFYIEKQKSLPINSKIYNLGNNNNNDSLKNNWDYWSRHSEDRKTPYQF